MPNFLKYPYTLMMFLMLIILPTICVSQQNFSSSRATYYTTNDEMGTTRGACGYEEYGRSTNNGEVCAVSSRLFKNGAGCGACYQVRCKSNGLCSEEGEKIMVTDQGQGQDKTDFILSYRAFARLAKQPRSVAILAGKGIVDVEYRRVSCKSTAAATAAANNLRVRIHKSSNYPHYLSFVLINQGGATDILAVDVYEEETYEWISMRRAYGAVWDLPEPPAGELKVRFLLSRGTAAKWAETDKPIIPTEWRAGLIIDTNLQVD